MQNQRPNEVKHLVQGHFGRTSWRPHTWLTIWWSFQNSFESKPLGSECLSIILKLHLMATLATVNLIEEDLDHMLKCIEPSKTDEYIKTLKRLRLLFINSRFTKAKRVWGNFPRLSLSSSPLLLLLCTLGVYLNIRSVPLILGTVLKLMGSLRSPCDSLPALEQVQICSCSELSTRPIGSWATSPHWKGSQESSPLSHLYSLAHQTPAPKVRSIWQNRTHGGLCWSRGLVFNHIARTQWSMKWTDQTVIMQRLLAGKDALTGMLH